MKIFERTIALPRVSGNRTLLSHLESATLLRLGSGFAPSRFFIGRTTDAHYECDVGVIEGLSRGRAEQANVFRFARRRHENTDRFIGILIVPTGIGAEIGGHAGDAGPVARMMGAVCDTLITHPNVVNASDINELPENALYVEGSVLTRLLMGTIGLQPVRSNRVLVVIDAHKNDALRNASINAVNGARAAYGLNCPKVLMLDPPLRMRAEYKRSGGASGEIWGLEALIDCLKRSREAYDAVAISSVIQVPHSFHQEYFDRDGEMVNPWGGVEALLTHALSTILDVPTAHSPMFESEEIANTDPGIVEPRMAAEAVSLTFLQCILKGLQRSPRIIADSDGLQARGVLTAADCSCLIIPDGCIGLPTLAALEQGITVIAVRENSNLMRNDLTNLPWAPGQLHIVENYWEVAGIIAALRAGVVPGAVRRPVRRVDVDVHSGREDDGVQMQSASQWCDA